MNYLGILSFLLIASSSVLCRNIHREYPGDVVQKELSPPPEVREEKVQNTSQNAELENINVTIPEAEMLLENAAVPTQVESGSSPLIDYQGKFEIPISKKRIQKMLKKAIVQIITGDLTTADMQLLKSLNYDADLVHKIREEELRKKKINQETIRGKKNPRNPTDLDNEKPEVDRDWKTNSAESESAGKNGYDYEAYNKQATYDYEYAALNFESNNGSWEDSLPEYDDRVRSSTESLPENGVASRPNVIFTIRYNDSEFDSNSEENPRFTGEENRQSGLNGTGNNFPAAVTSVNSSPAPVDDQIDTLSELYNITRNYFSTTEDTVEEDNEVDSQTIPSRHQTDQLKVTVDTTQQPEDHFRYENVQEPFEGEENGSVTSTTGTPNVTSNLTSGENRTIVSTRYKGLRWVQDNVYQVIPEYIDSLQTENMGNDSSESVYDDASYQNLDDGVIKNLTITEDLGPDEGMANDVPDFTQLDGSNANVSGENGANQTAYHQMVATERRRLVQKQKTEDEIKSRVLMVTGRLNSTGNSNPLQPRPEKLAMFSPTCGTPRNTDADLWQDSYSMNMQFHLNLTFDQHLVAARLRIFKLPQENLTATTSTIIDGVENAEKKIRISVYYYMRSLKKHRSIRKRLIDSKVSSLTTVGEHIALDVKDAVRYWRSSDSRNTNHGLVVLVEDQEGRPLQPSHYIQTPDCYNHTDSSLQDEKAYQRVPALFIRACTRYVRIVDNRVVTYEHCSGQDPAILSFHEAADYSTEAGI